MNSFFVYTDGASRGNPGEAGAAYLIFRANKKLVFKRGEYLGKATNNEAEYWAVVLALHKLIELKAKKAVFYLDSLLVVKQLAGKFKIKNERLQKFYLEIKRLIFQTGINVDFCYIPREKNRAADKLVNAVLNKTNFKK